MRRIITLLIGILFLSTNLNSQILDYDNNSKWFWGLNAGGTWHTTDVQSKTGFGLGLTLGRSFNYNYGKKLSFDIRGRFLHGDWQGVDTKRTDFTISNEALSSGLTNYKDSLGFAFRNFGTTATRLSLELVLHLNSIKERTGNDIYVFGGIGYTWFRAEGNYLQTTGNETKMYDFASWEEKLSKKEYRAMLDGTDETILDGSTKGKMNVEVLPSIGFGIGRQIAPRFTAGIEHKTTFTGLDYFDGVKDQGSFIKNDWYHYTSIYLQFHIKSRKNDRTTTHTNNNIDRNNEMQPPTVRFTDPSQPGTTTTFKLYNVKAEVKNVDRKEDITFMHNGKEIKAFAFNASSGNISAQVDLIEGVNNFEVTGRNVYGSDRAVTNLIYRKPDPVPPVVSFQNPSTSPRTVYSDVFQLEGTVLNVDLKNQVRLELNGSVINNFTFNTTNKKVKASLNLNYGTNVVQLTGTNDVGVDSKTTILIYSRESTPPPPVQNQNQPPIVYFTNPGYSPSYNAAPTTVLDAKVFHVVNKQNITFKQNGQVNYNFTYNASSKDFRSNVNLASGQNVFEIIGTNQDGTAQATTIIIFSREAIKPPVVTITSPSAHPYTASQDNLNILATVLNVSSKNQVEVKVNGQVTTNFTFINTNVSLNLQLASGTTIVDIKGTNQDGSDQKQTTIIYRKPTVQNPPSTPQTPPTVYYVNPSSSPYNSNVPTVILEAKVNHVSNIQNVTFKQNGQINTNFTFNPATQDFRSTVSLNFGQNVFEITGTNTAGSAQATMIVVYERTAKNPPVVTITSPNVNPYSTAEGQVNVLATVFNVSAKNQVEVKVNGQVTTNFTFINSTVNLLVSLAPGATVIDVKGTNSDGTDQKQTIINYRKPIAYMPNPPVVTITSPNVNPYNSTEAQVMFVANVQHVSSRSQVELKINGQVNTNFLFINNTLSMNIPLTSATGFTEIEVRGTNQDGTDQKQTTVIYRQATVQTPKPPIVSIVSPSSSPFASPTDQVNFIATVLNVTSKNQVEVKVNGVVFNNFTFANSVVQANIPIAAGSTTIEVKGTNQDGTDQKQTKVSYRNTLELNLNLMKPVVEIVTPSTNPEVTGNAIYVAVANVRFVNDESGIEVKVNGVIVNRIDFNPATTVLKFSASLNVGSNVIVVTGTNGVGTDSKTTTIVYENKPTIDKPVITYTNPARCPASFNVGFATIQGNITNITNASQAIFKVNGLLVSNVQTEMVAGKLNFSIPVQVGISNINVLVTANNAAGTVENSCLIRPIKPSIKPAKPTVKPGPVVKPKEPIKPAPAPTKSPRIVTPDRTPTVDPNAGGIKVNPRENGTVTPLP
ncbi:MAG: hypothetical protein PHQ74_11350 [Crocinitomicaceae bacterium]|nr:hypothetical protein [Crocinitomicaceae bacterium]